MRFKSGFPPSLSSIFELRSIPRDGFDNFLTVLGETLTDLFARKSVERLFHTSMVMPNLTRNFSWH